MPDVTKREFTILVILVVPTILFGIYPAAILDAIHYSVSTLIYSFDFTMISCDAPRAWGLYFQDSARFYLHIYRCIFFFDLIFHFSIYESYNIKSSIKGLLS